MESKEEVLKIRYPLYFQLFAVFAILFALYLGSRSTINFSDNSFPIIFMPIFLIVFSLKIIFTPYYLLLTNEQIKIFRFFSASKKIGFHEINGIDESETEIKVYLKNGGYLSIETHIVSRKKEEKVIIFISENLEKNKL